MDANAKMLVELGENTTKDQFNLYLPSDRKLIATANLQGKRGTGTNNSIDELSSHGHTSPYN